MNVEDNIAQRVEADPPAHAFLPMTIVAVRSCDAELLGPEQLILSQAEHYRESDVRFVIVNLSDGTPSVVALHEEALRRGFESVIVRDTSAFNAARMVPLLGELFRDYHPDVIHTHGSKSETLTLFARGRGHATLVGSFYGRIAMGPLRWQIFDAASLVTLRGFKVVIANSEATADQLRSARFPMRKVSVIPSTLGIEALPARDEPMRIAARAELGLPEGARVVATMARLYDEKGHRFFLRALQTLIPDHPDLRWLIIGDGPLRQSLSEEASALGLADRLIFAGYRADGWKLMAGADVCVVPSLREGISVSLLESAMLGVPIVATSVGGNPEVIVDEEGGILVQPADPKGLAEATDRMLRNSAQAARRGAFTRKRSLGVFSPATVRAKTHALYLEHLPRKRSALAAERARGMAK